MSGSALAFFGDYLLGKALDVAIQIGSEPRMQFDEIRRKHGEEAMFELDLAWKRHVAKQEQRDAEFAAKLRETVTEREVATLFPVLLRAAAESSVRERMRMLCAALAGILRPDLDAEMRSRVARTVLQLEPSDALYLRELEDVLQRSTPLPPPSRVSEWALASNGCIVVREPEDMGVHMEDIRRTMTARTVTVLGSAVVSSLRAWTPEPKPQ